jgi:hypothetical protein
MHDSDTQNVEDELPMTTDVEGLDSIGSDTWLQSS